MRLLCWFGVHRWTYNGATVRYCTRCRRMQTWDYTLTRLKGLVKWRSM